jgi:hypothetical protein
MSTSREAGAAFLTSVLADFDVLAERVERLQGIVQNEQRLRTESIAVVTARLSEIDQASTERSDELATSLAQWSATLGAQSLQYEDVASRMQAQEEELAGRMLELEDACRACGAVGEMTSQIAMQAQIDDLTRRLETLAGTVALNDKQTLTDLGRLSTSLATYREESKDIQKVARNSGGERGSADVVVDAQQRLNRLHNEAWLLQKEADTTDLSCLLAKIQGLEISMEARVLNAEASLQALAVELKHKVSSADMKCIADEVSRKATNTEVQSFRETISHLSFQVTLNQTQLKEIETTISPLPAHIQTVMTTVKAIDRRQDSESERTNACWVSLEKEVGTKVGKDDFQALVSRISKAEHRDQPLASIIASKASVVDLQGLMMRTEALEGSFGCKADAKAFEKTRLAVSNQVARHDELQSATESKFEALAGQMHALILKAESKSSRHSDQLVAVLRDQFRCLQDEVRACTGTRICTKDDLSEELMQFYPKVEIDALLSRIWWRLGQSGKVVGLGCLDTKRPERPQSARR